MSKKFTITYGGWYQRTTLHLSEIYSLFASGTSDLDLSKEKLKEFHKKLDIKKVSREAGYLEYIKIITVNGIEIRYYEDGLYVLELKADSIRGGKTQLEKYYNEALLPAINYIFSLGAPTPKILANIKTVHPIVVNMTLKDVDGYKVDAKKYGKVYSQINFSDVTVYKTPTYIFVAISSKATVSTDAVIEAQIFFREFKDQLEKYLGIHRDIWEQISEIKERKFIKGKEVGEIRNKLDSYKKTVSLIENRINQMGSYIDTRASVANHLKIKKYLLLFFQYKFEILTDSLDYITELWKMTSDYLDNAIQVIVEIENKTTSAGIESLRIITTIGVIAGMAAYLTEDSIPKLTGSSLIYFGVLIIVTWLVNMLVLKTYKARKHKLGFTERTSNI